MTTVDITRKVFEHIKAENSHLNMEVEQNPEHMHLAMYIKKQIGLDFDVFLSLQNDDEPHLQFEPLWGGWFPCTESDRVSEYKAAVNGVQSGSFRIKVISLRGQAVKALLQEPYKNEWPTIFTWSMLHLPLGVKNISYLQNQPNT